MAGPDLKTKDDVPLYELADTTLEMVDVFNDDASQGFVDMFTQEVSTRTFLARSGDFSWDEVAELEHAQTASLDDYQMAFGVDQYAKSLGFSREYIEDSPAELIEEHVAEVIAGGRDQIFSVVWDTLRNGIADGSTLWYTPEDHGDNTFTNTHDHTYTGLNNNANDSSDVLFGDTSSHTPTEIVRELSHDLTEHGYQPDTAIVNPRLADYFVEERSEGFGSQYYAPQAESIVENPTANQAGDVLQVAGTTIMQTQHLSIDGNNEHQLYMFDSDQRPVKTNFVRQMEITDNTGAPVGGAGGFRGDPGALLGTYASMRFGAVMDDPLAGVDLPGITDSQIALS